MSLPDQFWVNAESGEMVPVDHMHKLTLMADPERFGYTSHDIGKPLDMRIAFNHGWVRGTNSNGDTLTLETTNLRDSSKVVRDLIDRGEWFTDVFLDFDNTTQQAGIHLADSDEIEVFADRAQLPRRYRAATAGVAKRRPDPAGAVIGAMRSQVGANVGDRMESMIADARRRLFD